MRMTVLLGIMVALAACDPVGRGGANPTPSPNAPPTPTEPGISVGGSARVGVTYSSG